MYMPQALWTQAREQLDILTIVFANRTYQILRNEMRNVGVAPRGPKAETLTDIGKPPIDWMALARAFGVEAFRAATAEELSRHIDAGLALQGPVVIEVVL
jgi:acetolactate synthase-1/2/3 large subunit